MSDVEEGVADSVRKVNDFVATLALPVYEGQIAPWFDEPGGGIQYYLTEDIDKLIPEYLIEIDSD